MAQLNQIVAILKGVKSDANRAFTDIHHTLQKTALLAGISRSYAPYDEKGEQLPSESTLLQVRAAEKVREAAAVLTRLFDVTATQEWGNAEAKADIVVDGKTILTAVPVTYLIFLEKQLTDLKTFISKLPTLDPAEQWHYDPGMDAHATDPNKTVRTKKEARVIEKSPATDKHPAQVELVYEDKGVGTWATIKYSGALTVKRVSQLTERVEALLQAVKFAREAANSAKVTDQRVGKPIFDYLLAD